VGSSVRVTLACEPKGLRCTLSGRVVRCYSFGNLTNDAPGMLIELEPIEPSRAQQLDELAHTVRGAHLRPSGAERTSGGALL
jgi:hypothetical protein